MLTPAGKQQGLGLSLVLVLLACLAAWIYVPALHGPFFFDDDLYIRRNPLVTTTEGLTELWLAPLRSLDFWPLTYSIFWLLWRLAADTPWPYHAVNIAVHVAVALAAFACLRRLNRDAALAAALLFVAHPVAVPAVAWIFQLKTLLAALGFWAALLGFLSFLDTHKKWQYLASIVCFVLALLAKASAITLPLVMLLCLIWQGGLARLRSQAKLLLPFFGLALGIGVVTIYFQLFRAFGAAMPGQDPELGQRLLNLGKTIVFYWQTTVWPARLAILYPGFAKRWPDPMVAYAMLALLLVGLYASRRWQPWRWVAFGLGCSIACLLPVLGIIPMAFFRHSQVSDHWQYLALPWLLWVGTGLVAKFLNWSQLHWFATNQGKHRRPWPMVTYALLMLALTLTLAASSRQRAASFADPVAAWRLSLNIEPDSYLARVNLSSLLLGHNQIQEAALELQKASSLGPRDAVWHYNQTIVHSEAGRAQEALIEVEKALSLRPTYALAWQAKGYLLESQGHHELALEAWRAALANDEQLTEPLIRLARHARRLGQKSEAVILAHKLLSTAKGQATAILSVGWWLASATAPGDRDAETALMIADAALEATKDQSAQAHLVRAAALGEQGKFADAVAAAERGLALSQAPDEKQAFAHYLDLLRQGLPLRD